MQRKYPTWAVALGTVLALVGVVVVLMQILQQGSTKQWDTTKGMVEKLDVAVGTKQSQGATVTSCSAIISYSYEVDGKQYTGERLELNERNWRYENEVREFYKENAIEQGKEVEVYFDPEKPEDAVLIAGIEGAASIWPMALLGLLCLAGAFQGASTLRKTWKSKRA